MSAFGINVLDFGAKGDGITDDTAAIQSAINYAADRGGGRILFPYTPHGYRIASPGIEEIDGMPVRAQLVIPPGKNGYQRANIMLEGEMPCRLLNTYQVRPLESAKNNYTPTRFGMSIDNTVLFSDWDAPEEHDPGARPWSILAAPEGKSLKGKFSTAHFPIVNLEFRVPMDHERMYPTQSAVNLQNVSRVLIQDCQFCLGEQVGDTVLGKQLMPNPCHTAGLILSGDQNDNNLIRNAAVQGFRYGIVSGEHLVADYLYIHNCEEGLTFHDCSHLSVINHIVAQHNRVILSAAPDGLFGLPKGPCNVQIGTVNFECGTGIRPEISQLVWGVYDPDNRLHGSLSWHKPWGKQEFPVCGAERLEVTRF